MRFVPTGPVAEAVKKASGNLRRAKWSLLMLAVATCISARPQRADAADPLKTVRAFCEMDGKGIRLGAGRWHEIRPLVAWQLEPAWDRVRLIRGYEIGSTRMVGEQVEVVVTYTVVHDIRAKQINDDEHLETQIFHLAADESSRDWLLQGPPPPPYLFDNMFDRMEIQRSLEPGSGSYRSASVLVWMLIRAAGLDFPYLDTQELGERRELETVDAGEPGDLVVYLDGAAAYHVGLLEAEDSVVSATLNAGVRRAPLGAFDGQVRFRRLEGALIPGTERTERAEPDNQAAATPETSVTGTTKP